jgi:hypothetical protein
MAWFGGTSVASEQNGRSLRDYVRQHGDANILVTYRTPITGLKEIVASTQLTIEGTITVAESRLTAKEDDVYTEYEIEVTRIFRVRMEALPSMLGLSAASPFVPDDSLAPASPSIRRRLLLRRPNHGQVILDEGVLTVTSGPPARSEGQHVIISAYFDDTRGWWVPHGAFEIQNGQVLRLDKRWQTQDYKSVAEFAAALADPPPTKLPE